MIMYSSPNEYVIVFRWSNNHVSCLCSSTFLLRLPRAVALLYLQLRSMHRSIAWRLLGGVSTNGLCQHCFALAIHRNR